LPEIFGELEARSGCECQAFAEGAVPRFGKRVAVLASDVLPNGFSHDEATRTPLALGLGVQRRSQIGW
jgi:hypothetical protein